MKIRLLFILTLISITAFSAAAQQTRTVTNDNLEKYRQKRVVAERDLRENYERLGFPSPEELEKNIQQSRIERAELAARLRAEDLEREQLKLERERLNLDRQIAETEAQRSDYSQTRTGNYSFGANDFFFNYGYAPFGYNYQNFGYDDYGFGGYNFPGYGFPGNRLNRYNRRNFRFNNQPRIEYRNNLPVIVPPAPRPIRAPGTGGTRNRGGRRN